MRELWDFGDPVRLPPHADERKGSYCWYQYYCTSEEKGSGCG
jgi:hypothetical protein